MQLVRGQVMLIIKFLAVFVAVLIAFAGPLSAPASAHFFTLVKFDD